MTRSKYTLQSRTLLDVADDQTKTLKSYQAIKRRSMIRSDIGQGLTLGSAVWSRRRSTTAAAAVPAGNRLATTRRRDANNDNGPRLRYMVVSTWRTTGTDGTFGRGGDGEYCVRVERWRTRVRGGGDRNIEYGT